MIVKYINTTIQIVGMPYGADARGRLPTNTEQYDRVESGEPHVWASS